MDMVLPTHFSVLLQCRLIKEDLDGPIIPIADNEPMLQSQYETATANGGNDLTVPSLY